MDRPDVSDAEPPHHARAALAELRKVFLGEPPLSVMLQQVVELARQSIAGAADVSITLMQDGQAATVACAGPLAAQLDQRQYEAGFGPCMDAAVSGATVRINDTTGEAKYQDFARAAAGRGVRRTMSVGMPVSRQTNGALNIYGTDDVARFDAAAHGLAVTFASYAAVALAGADVHATTATLAANLQHALDSRAVINQAKGILMGRHGLPADAAFDLLARRSRATGRTLRDVAAELIAEVERGGPD